MAEYLVLEFHVFYDVDKKKESVIKQISIGVQFHYEEIEMFSRNKV